MYVVKFSLKPSKKLLCVFAVLAVIVLMVCAICLMTVHNKTCDTATCDELGTYSLIAESESRQCSFLEQFGLTPVADSVSKKEVIIPTDFNAVYEEYNELQKAVGLDLTKFKGKKAEMVTYELENATARYAVLLIYNDTVIGAHLTNGEYGESNLPLI